MKTVFFSRSMKISLQLTLLMALLLLNFGPAGLSTVYAAPTNDNWAAATLVPGVPYSQSLDVSTATPEPAGEPLPAKCGNKTFTTPSNTTVWYKFTSGSDRSVSFDTVGSNYDTYIAVWTGSAVNALTLVGCNDDNDIGLTSQLFVQLKAGVIYYIQVAKYEGAGQTLPPYNLVFNVKSQTFEDVPPTYWAWRYIEGLYSAGTTGGCQTSPVALYCPGAVVTRDQMAVFLLRGIHGAGFAPPLVGATTGFSDVSTTYWAASWIKELAAEGITGGCVPGKYCPTSAVTRDQMAIFLLRAKYGPGYAPPLVGATTGFSDVAPSYWAAGWIKQLAAEGITGGCGSGKFCPGSPVTRDQMAVFLDKTFGFPIP